MILGLPAAPAMAKIMESLPKGESEPEILRPEDYNVTVTIDPKNYWVSSASLNAEYINLIARRKHGL